MNELNVPYWCEQRIIVRLCGRLLAPCSFVFSEVTLMFFSVLSGFTGCSVGGFCDCPSEASHQRHGRKSRTGSTSSHSAQKRNTLKFLSFHVIASRALIWSFTGSKIFLRFSLPSSHSSTRVKKVVSFELGSSTSATLRTKLKLYPP